jgi:hypothetical protein
VIHKAKDLSREQRLAIEGLLGRAISEQEDIVVRALPQVSAVSSERRRQIIAALESHFAQVDAQRQSVSGEEANDIIDEALRSTRPAYRQVG